jgi:hypothetical protein
MKCRIALMAMISIVALAVVSLSLPPFSFALPNGIANASTSSKNSPPLLSGIISSLVFDIPLSVKKQVDDNKTLPFNITNVQKFILAGEWNIKLDTYDSNGTNKGSDEGNLKVTGFTADFLGISKDGKGYHTHQISNLIPTHNGNTNNLGFPHYNTLGLDGDAHVLGTVDVAVNNQKIWESVKTRITVSGGKTIEIMLDDKHIGYHFGKGQAIHGLVNGLYLR